MFFTSCIFHILNLPLYKYGPLWRWMDHSLALVEFCSDFSIVLLDKSTVFFYRVKIQQSPTLTLFSNMEKSRLLSYTSCLAPLILEVFFPLISYFASLLKTSFNWDWFSKPLYQNFNSHIIVFPHGNFKSLPLTKFLFTLKFMDVLLFSLIPEGHFTRWGK